METIFQSKEWEEFKLKTGYQKSYWIDGILVLQKNLPLGWSMLYSPMVGQAQLDKIIISESRIQNFTKQIKTIGKENKAILYRLELDAPLNTKYKILNTAFGFTKSFEEMQPEHTLVVDLTKSEEEILAQFKPKGRYNIKVAQKNNIGITSTNATGKELNDFYSLYEETAKRHRITHRAKTYFSSLLEILGPNDYARIYSATTKIGSKKITLASAIIIYSGKKAIYMFGSSGNQHKNLMAPYFLHWQILQEAKAQGMKKYDFFGIAPNDDPKHPWAGVTQFKKRFGGEERSILGSYDLILNPVRYYLFKIAEKIRR